jgi:peptide/nickel transport system ATP-binding protein
MSENPALLTVEDLCVDYATESGFLRAVDEVSFSIGPGEIFGLAGESGSGKSTIIQAILRLLKPPGIITGGEVDFAGHDLLALDAEGLRKLRWCDISLVCQSAMNALNPVITVGEQLGDAIVAHEGVSVAEATRRAAKLLELVGIAGERVTAYPHELSGGMRQRVVIAMALALKPRLVIMDEPTTALDVVVQKEILQRVIELRRELGFAILFITHDLSLMFELCTHVGILYAGKLIEFAPADQLFETPAHPYTRGLMNSFPDLHGEGDDLKGVPGNPPDLRHPPSGCRFHPRCPDAKEECAQREPVLVELGAEHRAACHFVDLAGETNSEGAAT